MLLAKLLIGLDVKVKAPLTQKLCGCDQETLCTDRNTRKDVFCGGPLYCLWHCPGAHRTLPGLIGAQNPPFEGDLPLGLHPTTQDITSWVRPLVQARDSYTNPVIAASSFQRSPLCHTIGHANLPYSPVYRRGGPSAFPFFTAPFQPVAMGFHFVLP